jgi:serine/threonine protein kinase
MQKYEKQYKKYHKKIIFGGRHDDLRKKIITERLNNFEIEIESPITGNDIHCCIENIGSGSFGSVSKGIDDITGKTIIIKKIKISKEALRRASIPTSSDIDDTSMSLSKNTKNKIIEKLEKEIKIMQKLNHKNIIKYIGHKEEDDENSDSPDEYQIIQKKKIKNKFLSIYMEDICGKSLSKIAQSMKGVSLNLISLYSKQILEALDYIHSQGIIHMDIKGDNILLSNNGEIKVIDFGESVQIDTDNFQLPYGGSLLFMAPEILNPYNIVTNIELIHLGKSDIWSFGVVLIEMFVGKLYYPDDMPMNHKDIFSHSRKDNLGEYFIEIFMKNLLSKIEINKNDVSKKNYDDISDINNSLVNLLFDEENSRIVSFIDFIGCCLEIDYQKRWSAQQLLYHPFFDNNQIQQQYLSTLMTNL